MKYFSILISSILLTSSCALFQAPITITLTNPNGFNIKGHSVTLTWGSYSSDVALGTTEIYADSSGVSYSLTGYPYVNDFVVIAETFDESSSNLFGGTIIDTNTSLNADIILYYDDELYLEGASSWISPTILSGGASSNAPTNIPFAGQWYTDTLSAGNQLWYKFNTTKGRQYAVAWYDKYFGGLSLTAYIDLYVYDSSFNPLLSDSASHYVDGAVSFISFDDYVLVKIVGQDSLEAGTFKFGLDDIAYVTGNRMSNNPKSAKPHFTGKLPKWAKK